MPGAGKLKMSPEAAAARRAYMNAYMKKWRHNNKDKIKQYQKNYWDKKAKESVENEIDN